MLFFYAARNEKGKFVQGSLESPNQAAALAMLRTRSLFVSALDAAGTLRSIPRQLLFSRRVSSAALASCLRGFAALLRAGVPLARALPLCADDCQDKRLSEALRAVEAYVAAGTTLSDAMLRQPREFSQLVAGTVRAGEHAAALDDVLDKLGVTLERNARMRKKLANALAYPAVVSCMTLAVLVLLVTTTVPTFAEMYRQLRVPQPMMLQLLVTVGQLLHAPHLLSGIASATVVALAVARSQSKGSQVSPAAEAIRLGAPVVGPIARKTAIARIARLLGMLLDCGVSLHAAVPMVRAATEYPRFHASLVSLERSLADGSSIALPLAAAGMYPPLFLQLVRVGEETGRISEMLGRAASYYEDEVEHEIQRLGTLVEPLMIAILGGAIGLIAAAIFVPLYSLIGSIK